MPDDDFTLRDALEAAGAEGEEAAEPEAPEEGAEAAPAEETAPGSAEDATEVVEAAEEVPEGEATAEPAEEASPEALDAPAHWSLEDQTMFRQQSPEIQQYLLDRDKAMTAAHTKRSQEIAPLRKVAENLQPYLEQMGATPDQYFTTLAQTEYQLRTGTPQQQMQVLFQLGQQYIQGFDQIISGAGGAATSPANGNGAGTVEDPFGVGDVVQAHLQQAVGPLAQQVQQITGHIGQQTQAQQQQRERALTEQVQAFEAETGADGKPAHPYFAEVVGEMAAMAQAETAAGHTPDLQALYDRATWANPTVREKMLAAKEHVANLERKRELEKRRSAAGGLAGGGPSTSKEQPRDLKAAIAAARAEHGA